MGGISTKLRVEYQFENKCDTLHYAIAMYAYHAFTDGYTPEVLVQVQTEGGRPSHGQVVTDVVILISHYTMHQPAVQLVCMGVPGHVTSHTRGCPASNGPDACYLMRDSSILYEIQNHMATASL